MRRKTRKCFSYRPYSLKKAKCDSLHWSRAERYESRSQWRTFSKGKWRQRTCYYVIYHSRAQSNQSLMPSVVFLHLAFPLSISTINSFRHCVEKYGSQLFTLIPRRESRVWFTTRCILNSFFKFSSLSLFEQLFFPSVRSFTETVRHRKILFTTQLLC